MERKMGQFGLADYYVAKNRVQASFLDGVDAMMNWKRIEKLLHSRLGRDDKVVRAGSQPYPALIMFKILLLQQWYGLSGQETEFALLDRISFSRFTGIALSESVPDHTTICRFRNLLVEKVLLEPLLDEVNKQFARQGKLVKKGVAVDASIVTSAARPRKQVEIEYVAKDREEDAAPTTDEMTKVSVSYSNYLLMAYQKFLSKLGISVQQIFQLVCLNLFGKESLDELLNPRRQKKGNDYCSVY
ncbi:MAG: transposase [Deltaproteobacteria bacterium]|jgi:IS5 family transposase|nr:transposase [Deltaproteobacteria bacterium]